MEYGVFGLGRNGKDIAEHGDKKGQNHKAVQKCRGRGAFEIIADRKRNQRKKGKHPELTEKCLDDFDLQGKNQGDDFNRPDAVNSLGNMLSDDGKVTDSV